MISPAERLCLGLDGKAAGDGLGEGLIVGEVQLGVAHGKLTHGGVEDRSLAEITGDGGGIACDRVGSGKGVPAEQTSAYRSNPSRRAVSRSTEPFQSLSWHQ